MRPKDREGKGERTYLRSVVKGIAGAVIFLILILIAAALSEKFRFLYGAQTPTAKLILALASFLAGCAGSRGIETGKFLHALAGESALFLTIAACAAASDAGFFSISVLVDIVIMLFGGFASALLGDKKRIKRRGNR